MASVILATAPRASTRGKETSKATNPYSGLSPAVGPYWARLPRLTGPGTLSECLNTPAAQSAGTLETSVPVVAPDRAAAARVLLQETQTCIQSFSARMNEFTRSLEQTLQEIKRDSSAASPENEKIVSDVS